MLREYPVFDFPLWIYILNVSLPWLLTLRTTGFSSYSTWAHSCGSQAQAQ